MKDFSYTSIVGYVRILVILVSFGAVVMGRMTLLNAVATITAIIGLLGSAGFIAAKDASQPEEIARMTVSKEVDGTTTTKLTATVEEEKK